MLWVVAKKELIESLLNARFVGACVVSLVLVLTSIVVLTRNYGEQFRDYQSRVREQEQFIDNFGHYNRLGWMSRQMRPPSYFQVLVLGIDREAEQENFISNPVPALLSRLDFVSIVTIIFSLMAILFSYDAISGEREAGLLRQLMAAGVSRRTILLGKLLGGTTSLLIPYTIGVLAGFIYIALNPALQLQRGDFGVFAILLVVSWIYIIAFYALGLLFSSRSRTSGQSVLKSLFAWVILVLVIPNISPFLAAQLYPIPSAAKVEQETNYVTDVERDQILRTRWREILDSKYSDLKSILALGRTAIEERLKSDLSFKERYGQYTRDNEDIIKQVNREQSKKAEKMAETFVARSKHQENLAMILTSISPYSNFVFIATDITETGIAGENYWGSQSGQYIRELGSYADSRYQNELKKNPAYDSNDYLDLRERPRFQYRPSGIEDRIEAAFPQFGILLLFNLLFLAGALMSFQRYDVR
jgi:ABC-type transport system involved in multi-copper enzyme maturation permease subunit